MIPYLPKYFTSKAIAIYCGLLVICTVVFLRILPILWVVFGLIEVILFFTVSNSLTKSWAKYPNQTFIKKLFWRSIIIRVAYIIFIYFFYNYINGEPFEFEAGDSQGYHQLASWIVDMLKKGDLSGFYKFIGTNYSDMGYPLYLGIIYSIFGKSIIFVRILKAIIGAYTCILIYKLACRCFNETNGRIAGIMAMLSPTLIYYCGLHLKETEMIFLIVLFLERADYMLRSKTFTPKILLTVSILGILLFFFRTILGVAAFFSLFTAILFIPNKIVKLNRKVTLCIFGGVIVLSLLGGTIQKNINKYLEMSETNQNIGMASRSTRKGGNKLATYGSTAVFAPLVLIGPFPTLVNIETQQNQMLLNGGYFVRNILGFFLFLSLFVLYKQQKIGENSLILSFILCYLAIVAMSTFALSERFHLPAVPFIIIFAAHGITQLNEKSKTKYLLYLVFISIIIIAWNWFKLAGRA